MADKRENGVPPIDSVSQPELGASPITLKVSCVAGENGALKVVCDKISTGKPESAQFAGDIEPKLNEEGPPNPYLTTPAVPVSVPTVTVAVPRYILLAEPVKAHIIPVIS